ncbi:Crp/Fnr family transcriptional regulator [Anaerotignum sp. MB30-C6]|uniref:Crp/Fnr family transcriptional regulator n=1 Tax=Anaerotignum sp. MB30-C6 TaxID=3070814 RepID=UPI0027DB1810|nr:cyclic nucleotide-binding domain-containing protein [Anaerotignum sp. MB30-C6]WMI80035.1 cyclic nucleotide-binding domain-containing protein [Anaerotignum sp. MB30-C6]
MIITDLMILLYALDQGVDILYKYRDSQELRKYLALYQLEGIIHKDMEEYHEFHRFKKGDLLCELGEPLRYFYILLKGNVKVYTTSDNGKILTLRIFDTLTNLGDIELITGTKYRCSVEVLSNSLCLAFPMQVIQKIGLNDNAFLRYLCSDLCNKFDHITSVSSSNILYPLRNRLASFMLEYLSADSNVITFPYSHKELAELLGTTYRHLTRSLGELESRGLIEMVDGTIYVLDEVNLRKLHVETYPHKV